MRAKSALESDRYDLIVFDTAPTGHTLKLLGMPDVLQAGIEKLQEWQSTLWGYWDVLKGAGSGAAAPRRGVKEEVAVMLENYKRGIQKVRRRLDPRTKTAIPGCVEALGPSVTSHKRMALVDY